MEEPWKGDTMLNRKISVLSAPSLKGANEDFDGKSNCSSFRLPSGSGQAERMPLFLSESGFP